MRLTRRTRHWAPVCFSRRTTMHHDRAATIRRRPRYHRHGDATNLATGKRIRIKCAQRLRGEAKAGDAKVAKVAGPFWTPTANEGRQNAHGGQRREEAGQEHVREPCVSSSWAVTARCRRWCGCSVARLSRVRSPDTCREGGSSSDLQWRTRRDASRQDKIREAAGFVLQMDPFWKAIWAVGVSPLPRGRVVPQSRRAGVPRMHRIPKVF